MQSRPGVCREIEQHVESSGLRHPVDTVQAQPKGIGAGTHYARTRQGRVVRRKPDGLPLLHGKLHGGTQRRHIAQTG